LGGAGGERAVDWKFLLTCSDTFAVGWIV